MLVPLICGEAAKGRNFTQPDAAQSPPPQTRRRVRRNVIATDLVRQMAIGVDMQICDPMLKDTTQGASVGFSRKTVRNSRRLVLNCVHDHALQKRSDVAKAGCSIVAGKLCWDEAACRLYADAKTVNELFPKLKLADESEETTAPADATAASQPSATTSVSSSASPVVLAVPLRRVTGKRSSGSLLSSGAALPGPRRCGC